MQKNIQDYSVEELKQAGFDLYQKRTQASQVLNECNQNLQVINDEMVKRDKKTGEAPVEPKSAPTPKKK